MKLFLLLSLVAFAAAKCPNDCNGHGTCNVYSACECYRNWMAADCSERVCYFGHAFVDTPQGDLNADGRTDLTSAAYHVVLGSEASFFKGTTGAATVVDGYYKGKLADGTVKSAFRMSGVGAAGGSPVYAVEDDITTEYQLDQSSTSYGHDLYGFTQNCHDTHSTSVQYTIAFEVTGVEQVTYVKLSGGKTCAAGARVYLAADNADANAKNAAATVGYVKEATDNKAFLLLRDVERPAISGSLVLYCGDTKLTVPSSATSFPAGAAGTDFEYFQGFCGDGACNAGKDCDNIANSAAGDASHCLHASGTGARTVTKVCSVIPAAYKVQWSNVREWESYPTDHGVARLGGDKNSSAAAGVAKAAWDEGHFYRECSNKGTCNRSSGLCECYAGYEGEGCTRMACPNDCSGHGVCKRAIDRDSSYVGWDAYKSQSCECDGGYTGTDCSMRVCPRGDDPVTRIADRTEIQKFGVSDVTAIKDGSLSATAATEAFFALEFTTELGEKFTTRSIDFLGYNVAADVESALESLPHSVIEDVEVSLAVVAGSEATLTVPSATYTAGQAVVQASTGGSSNNGGASGTVKATVTATSVVVTVTSGVFQTTEVGGAITINGTARAASAASTAATPGSRHVSVTFAHNSGDLPDLGARYNWHVAASGSATQPSRNTAAGAFEASGTGGAGTKGFKLTTLQNGNKENDMCSNRGLCDYSTGVCKCFGGFTDFDCSVQNALATA